MNNQEKNDIDLIPLEEVGPENDRDREDIMSLACVRTWQQTYGNSLIPFIILDKTLRILWENATYNREFTRGTGSLGVNLTTMFSSYLDDDKTSHIYKSIRSEEHGYSWRGRLESDGREYSKIIANTMIFPIIHRETFANEPVGYCAIFDDITNEYRSLLKNTFLSLLEASKLKDNDTGQHIQRVNEYSSTLAKQLYKQPDYPEVDVEFIEQIGFLAAMHDVGKIGTPDDILNKTGPLDDREWKIMREHTINGAYILNTYPNPMAKQIALFHHERWDGSGYPYQISGAMIPLAARIVALADVYDALRMKRSYKQPMDHSSAYTIINESKGSHLEPDLVELFCKHATAFEKIYERLAD